MKEMILKSVQIIGLELPYLLVLAIFFNIIFDLPSLVILFGILGFILQVIVFARGVELVRDGNVQGPNLDKFRMFFGDYFFVTLIIITPMVLLVFTIGEKQAWMIHGMEGAISLATLYVAPYLFLKGTRLKSIILGINHLRFNFISSLPLLILTAIPWVLKLMARPLIFTGTDQLKTNFPILIVGYVFSLISICFALVVFYTACMVLLKQEDKKKQGG